VPVTPRIGIFRCFPGAGGQCRHGRLGDLTSFEPGDETGQWTPIRVGQRLDVDRAVIARVEIGALDHIADHASEAHALPVLRGVDALDSVSVQFGDFVFHDHAAAAAEQLDPSRAALVQQIDGVFEIFDMAALVGADGDALHILLNRGRDDLVHRAIVAEMNHLHAGRLEYSPHDVDCGVVAIEQARRGDEADLVSPLCEVCGSDRSATVLLEITLRDMIFSQTDRGALSRSCRLPRRQNDSSAMAISVPAPAVVAASRANARGNICSP